MVYSAADTLPCLPAALPVADLLATVYRPLDPLPPGPAPAHRREIQASLGQLATVMAGLWAPGAGWPTHLPRTPAALLPYLSEEVEAVREAWHTLPSTMGSPTPGEGVLDDWATWVLEQLVACGPEVMALLEGGAVRLVPAMTLALPQTYCLDLVTCAPWDATTALPPETLIPLPLDAEGQRVPVATVLDRLWQRLGDHCPALVALAQGWPGTLLPPGRGEGQGTLTLTLFLTANAVAGTELAPVEMPPPGSELVGDGDGFQPLAQAALGVLAWGRGGRTEPIPGEDLALITALTGMDLPWGQGVTWGQLWPWLRWWVVQADPEIMAWLAGVPGRWLVPGHSWREGRLGLGVSLRFTPPGTQWQVDVMAGTWQGERAEGLPSPTRLQGVSLGEPGAVNTVAQVRSHLETRLRQGTPALAPLWEGMAVRWGLPAEPTTALAGTLTLQVTLKGLPA